MPTDQEGIEDKHLFFGYMGMRDKIFSLGKGWNVWLPSRNDLDIYDQYDAEYIVAQNMMGEVVGGARFIRTDRGGANPAAGQYTYMIRDAQRGLLNGLPDDLCENPPCSSRVWELTRFVTNGQGYARDVLMESCLKFLKDRRAKSFIFLGPQGFKVMARRFGYQLNPLGPLSRNKDGQFQVFLCNI
ncbi:acyl-homoserine-lactone synthase [Phaeobacter gallaeciensis]|uniref:acyl-homoserine-lactone synthase n=1 Tax=Phaeobacter gallaeciensis TaxID=60890 RepID=UPI002380252A|nr:acyl-homoserine-lactone synthase [Phaeobacter gallaeciensis]MDE4297159.1 acyl-homoserine-lactone synthase [Phaeobacter gallaeciensis]